MKKLLVLLTLLAITIVGCGKKDAQTGASSDAD